MVWVGSPSGPRVEGRVCSPKGCGCWVGSYGSDCWLGSGLAGLTGWQPLKAAAGWGLAGVQLRTAGPVGGWKGSREQLHRSAHTRVVTGAGFEGASHPIARVYLKSCCPQGLGRYIRLLNPLDEQDYKYI